MSRQDSPSEEKGSDILSPITSGHYVNVGHPQFVLEGDLTFVGEQGGNGVQATYQDVYGAPVETVNPLGYEVGWWSALFLNITMLIGTGIFSFRECAQRLLECGK